MLRLKIMLAAALLLSIFCGCGQARLTPEAEPDSVKVSPQLRTADGASTIVPGHFVIIYSDGRAPAPYSSATATLNPSDVQAQALEDDATFTRLSTVPGVDFVLRDRYVEGHQISSPGNPNLPIDPNQPDSFYRSSQNWAVLQAGGYGAGVPGGPTFGPWDRTQGAGIRIAILDSGVDVTHPDIAPNLALSLTEVDTTALPTPCDDGTPQDQQGHGTWTASLATGAAGPGTGGVIGVAPQATLLNIKVLERIPTSAVAQCTTSQAAGLLSWVLLGINDAVTHKADIVSLSLGSVVDLQSGDGAGWKAAFDRATHAASAAGVVVIAAVGNDALDLSGTGANPARYIELPAQARYVLPVVAATNPACAESLAPNAACAPGPVTRPFYSNFGVSLNAIAAPGGSFPNVSDSGVNGWIRGACSMSGCFNLGPSAYVQAMGTSASAPLVAGAAALLRATHPHWNAEQTINALRLSASHSGSMQEPQLNTGAALTLP